MNKEDAKGLVASHALLLVRLIVVRRARCVSHVRRKSALEVRVTAVRLLLARVVGGREGAGCTGALRPFRGAGRGDEPWLPP